MQNKTARPHILLVDDDPGARRSLIDLLTHAGYAVTEARTLADARRLAEGQEPGLAVLDLVLPDGDGLTLLKELRALWPALPAIVVTAYIEPRSIVEAMKRGAIDYLAKPIDPDSFLSTCRSALANRAPVDTAAPAASLPIIGDSAAAARMRDSVQRLARSRPRGVLVVGEPGTGKTWLAQALHAASSRRGGPCLVYPCADAYGPGVAIFGVPGNEGTGLLAAAQHGTLILDGVDRLDHDVHRRLLERLEAGTVPLLVGLATGTDGDSALMSWLGRATIAIPPLKERPTDVPLLARHFLAEAGRALDRRFDGFARGAEQQLIGYTWPGNVQELKDTVWRLASMIPGGTIHPEHVQSILNADATPLWVPAGEPRPLREITDAYIDHVIAYTGGNKTRAAKILKVARETLRSHLLARNAAV